MEAKLIFNGNSNNLTPNIPQEKALIAFSKSKQNGQNRALLVLPSGTGKTRFSAFETYDFPGNILYIAHRNEILIQAKEEFKKVHNIKDEDIGFYNGTNKQSDRKITFASIQTISRTKNLKSFARDFFDYIIFDEWHHSAAPTAIKVLNYLKPKYLLAMTATPYRLDGKDILQHVNYNIPYQMELKEGIESDFLVPFIYYGLWDDIDYSNIKWGGYKYTQKDLNKKLLIDKRDNAVIKEVKEKMGNRKCIGFCCSVKHVERCVKKFNKAGFSTIGLHHRIEAGKKEDIVTNFREGKYQIIFTVDLFNEGVDFPEVEGLLFLRPTFSKRVFFQQLGRGLRKNKGKENVLVLDFIGNYTNAYLVRKWLGKIIPTGDRGIDSKTEYRYSTSKVYFDDRVIDLFEMQEPVSDETIIEDYHKLKEEIGRVPLMYEFKWGYKAKYRWGTWRKFLRYLGENITDEKIIKDYYKLKEELGRVPVRHEFKWREKVVYKWGTWHKFLNYLGESVLRRHLVVSLEDIKIEYFRLKKLLKQTKPLTTIQIDALCTQGIAIFRPSSIYRHGLSFNEFLLSIGEKTNKEICLDEKSIIKIYKKAKGKKGIVPCFNDVPIYYNTLKRLGYDSWASFVKSRGDKPRHAEPKHASSKQEIIDDVRRVWDEVGKQPTIGQYNKNGLYSDGIISRKFNMNWTEFMVNVMGVVPSKITKDDLEMEYVRLRNMLGRHVTGSDLKLGLAKYSEWQYRKMWGKLSIVRNHLEKKYFDNYVHSTKQDCIDVYIEERKKSEEPIPIIHIKKISHYFYTSIFGNLTKAKEECEKEYIKWKKESDKT